MSTSTDAVFPARNDFMPLAQRILGQTPLIDGHNDFPYIIRGWFLNQLDNSEPKFNIQDMPIGQTDLTRLARGRVGGQFWSVYIPCGPQSKNEGDNTEIEEERNLLSCVKATLQQIDLVHALVEQFPSVFGFVQCAADIMPHFRAGRIASLIGVEGLHQIGNSASVLRMYHRLGVRYVTLTHDCNNQYADSATSKTQLHGGLSEEGKTMLKEMNRIGMIIDLSHTSENTQKDALQVSQAPVIFSHSSCYTLCPNPRNVSDEVLDRLAQNGGLLMICFLTNLLASPDTPPSASSNSSSSTPNPQRCPPKATLAHVVDHIIYAGARIGFGHVGIGSDFDGMLQGPQDLDDVSRYPYLVAELLRRGVSEEEVRMVVGGNVIGLLESVEQVARRLKDGERVSNEVGGGGGGGEGTKMLCDEIAPSWTEAQRGMLLEQGHQRRNKNSI